MGRLFGTDGVRGVANTELTSSLAYRLGKAGTYVLGKTEGHRPRILVGKDTRISGDMLEAALVAGICSMGGEAVEIGVLPTPAVAYLVRKLKCDAGVVISASHNSYEFNGIKFFNGDGFKLPDKVENEIEEYILDGKEYGATPIGAELGKKTVISDALRMYVDFVETTVDCDFKGLKVAMDCANGASYLSSPTVFRELGAEVFVLSNEPNGVNINDHCGSTHPENLQKFVQLMGADVGFAFDGDADRLIAIDETGKEIHGDFVLSICGNYLKEQGKLKNNTIVGTVMSNMGLDIAMEKAGIQVARTKVGDRYVLEEMLNKGYIIGGEQSGHVIFLEHNTTGDGLITALQLLSVVKKTGRKLSDLAQILHELPQVLVNARVTNEKKTAYLTDREVQSAIQSVEAKLAGNGRVLIRASGTEPLIRVMLEGEDPDELQKDAQLLAELIAEKSR